MTNVPDVDTYGEDGVSRITPFADVYETESEDERDDVSYSDDESGSEGDVEDYDDDDSNELDNLARAYPEMRSTEIEVVELKEKKKKTTTTRTAVNSSGSGGSRPKLAKGHSPEVGAAPFVLSTAGAVER